MKINFIAFALLFIVFWGCAGNEKAAVSSSSCNLSGRYVNNTILEKCPASMPVDIPYYAFELSFKSKDTVEISNGIEKFQLPFVETNKKCQYKILEATQFGEMYFTVIGDSEIHLVDSAWTKVNSESTFLKTNISTKGDWGFENYINECVIAGEYSKEGQSNPVYFLPNGQVSGLKPYLSYSLCYAGDCLEETTEKSTIIEFFTDKGKKELFALKMPTGKSLIQFYNIGNPIPDTKGVKSIGDLAFEIKSQASK